MRRVVLVAWAMAAAAAVAACRASPPALRKSVENQDRGAVIGFKRGWEKGWSDAWALTSMRITDIDHYKQGVVLEWTRDEGPVGTRTRHDAFTLDGRFYSAGEEVIEHGRLVARAAVYLTDQGEPVYRTVVRFAEGKPVFDELEVFSGGRPASTYRSQQNFGVQSPVPGGPASPRLTRVPADAVLVAGPPSPEVERVRETQRSQ